MQQFQLRRKTRCIWLECICLQHPSADAGGKKQLWNEKRSRKLEISPERLRWLNPISLWINRPFTQVMIKGDLNVIRKSLSSIEQQFIKDNTQQGQRWLTLTLLTIKSLTSEFTFTLFLSQLKLRKENKIEAFQFTIDINCKYTIISSSCAFFFLSESIMEV